MILSIRGFNFNAKTTKHVLYGYWYELANFRYLAQSQIPPFPVCIGEYLA